MGTQTLLLALAAVLIGIRLPSFFRRQGMSKRDSILFIAMIFFLLFLAWGAVQLLGKFI